MSLSHILYACYIALDVSVLSTDTAVDIRVALTVAEAQKARRYSGFRDV